MLREISGDGSNLKGNRLSDARAGSIIEVTTAVTCELGPLECGEATAPLETIASGAVVPTSAEGACGYTICDACFAFRFTAISA